MNLCKTHYGTLAVGECIACKLYDRITELEQEVERLQTERDEAEELLEQSPTNTEYQRLRSAFSKQEVERLREALNRIINTSLGCRCAEIAEQALESIP